MTFQFDPTSEFQTRVREQLESDDIAWLTTVSSDGIPQPNPVWFVWEDGSFVILSKPGQAKVANIQRHHGASINLETTRDGGVVIFSGKANIVDRSEVSARALERMESKYRDGLASLGMSREQFEEEYSATIRFTPGKVRGW